MPVEASDRQIPLCINKKYIQTVTKKKVDKLKKIIKMGRYKAPRERERALDCFSNEQSIYITHFKFGLSRSIKKWSGACALSYYTAVRCITEIPPGPFPQQFQREREREVRRVGAAHDATRDIDNNKERKKTSLK